MGAKPLATSISTSIKLDRDENSNNVDEKLYRCMIDSLLYLMASSPDIMFNVRICARFQSLLTELHLIAVKCIFRNLIQAHDLGIFYPRRVGFDLNRFSYAEYVGCKVDQ